jgi:ABC-2 type transport system ATP-binding protein
VAGPSIPLVLELEGVTKDYGRRRALDAVSTSLRPGVVGLLGPNGAGKSTLIKTVLGLVRLSSGCARVLGHDSRREFRRVRQLVGYMPEDDCILPGLKGVEAVAYTGELAGLPQLVALRRAHEVLDYVGIGEERYREVQTYSTGMRQKQKLAQAIVHDPRLVFLDEPTSGLDPLGRERMLKLVRALFDRAGVSVVLSTHILRDVEQVCDDVLILGGGELLVHDTVERLRRPVDESVVVALDEELPAFAEALRASGARFEHGRPGQLRLYGEPSAAAALAMEAARRTGAVVHRLERGRNSLEDIFLSAVGATPGKAPAAAGPGTEAR